MERVNTYAYGQIRMEVLSQDDPVEFSVDNNVDLISIIQNQVDDHLPADSAGISDLNNQMQNVYQQYDVLQTTALTFQPVPII